MTRRQCEPATAHATRRQRIVELLEDEPKSFHELRARLATSVRDLEDDLRHVERSLRGAGRRLAIETPRCGDCTFVFRGRERRHIHPPGRCPRCRSEHILAGRLSIRG